MEFIADFHIHSYLSRATAKNLDLEHLNLWAKLKGIAVVGTGDFTHPQWFSELSEKLEPAEDGLFALRPEFAAQTAPMVPSGCDRAVRFVLSVEISSIYKKNGKTRKVHNLILVPTLGVAERLNKRLDRIGNIASDGRPILGLDSKALLEIVLEVSEDAVLIPAHIWTPWFSVLGSKSGFDSIEECFEELTPHIFAAETGLSSDPAMNWRVSSLDGLALVSNSDAHSPANLGREANLFDTKRSYSAMMDALRREDSKGFLGTLEYFAEEGKYHFDGHRKCGVRLCPAETIKNHGLCPVCGRPVTIGVMYRVEALADREPGRKPAGARAYTSLLPLTDILSDIFQVGPKSKKVTKAYHELLDSIGPEFEILRNTSLAVLDKTRIPLLAEALRRVREGHVQIAPGFDGEFGSVRLFDAEERQALLGQGRLFAMPAQVFPTRQAAGSQPLLFGQPRPQVASHEQPPHQKKGRAIPEAIRDPEGLACPEGLLQQLNPQQRQAVCHAGGPLLIVAGPGTGKTRTLTHRIAYLLFAGLAGPERVLAVTFTNKAAQEMGLRLRKIMGDPCLFEKVTIRTFHALCLDIIAAETQSLGGQGRPSVLNESDRKHVVKLAIREVCPGPHRPEEVLGLISMAKQDLLGPEDDLSSVDPDHPAGELNKIYRAYQQRLLRYQCVDFDDLIFSVVKLFESNPRICEKYQNQFAFISVDEYQDINFSQYRLVRLIAPPSHDICVIGDPDQAIYGFRGADVRFFHRFSQDYPAARTIYLSQNYRSTETILKASGQVIRTGAKGRQQTRPWSGIQGTERVTIAQLPTERSEAEYIVKTIDQHVGGISHFSVDSGRVHASAKTKERGFGDFAVLYRLRDQTHALKEAFERSGIPFQVVGEKKLGNRTGIVELISYMKMAWSVSWDLDVERVLAFSATGLGERAVEALKKKAEDWGCCLLDALARVEAIEGLQDRVITTLLDFNDDMQTFKRAIKGKSVSDQIRLAMDSFGFSHAMSDEETFHGNVERLLAIAHTFGNDHGKFLASLALENEQDSYVDEAEKVALMTMHASKGLEFRVVFVIGCENGLIPYCGQKGENSDLSEERRLFYVALTRAREALYLTHAKTRMCFGKRTVRQISPFVEAIAEELKCHERSCIQQRDRQKAGTQLRLFDL